MKTLYIMLQALDTLVTLSEDHSTQQLPPSAAATVKQLVEWATGEAAKYKQPAAQTHQIRGRKRGAFDS